MEMNDFRMINAPRDRVWVALNDPSVLRQCVIGCESLEKQDDGSLDAAMAVRVGPVSAKFKGKLRLENVKPPESYTLVFEGSGGAAGFAKGTASVTLTPENGQTKLAYTASSQIGGKLAQVGSRLIDAAAKKIADDFFNKFGELVGGAPAATGDGADTASAGAPGSVTPVAAVRSGPPAWLIYGGGVAVVVALFVLLFL